jgi:transcription initiation factor TFIIIB Brf1 subunit/transcription initiation factor TFIIB
MKKIEQCPSCGGENPSEDTVCLHCGCLIEESNYDAISDEEDR